MQLGLGKVETNAKCGGRTLGAMLGECARTAFFLFKNITLQCDSSTGQLKTKPVTRIFEDQKCIHSEDELAMGAAFVMHAFAASARQSAKC